MGIFMFEIGVLHRLRLACIRDYKFYTMKKNKIIGLLSIIFILLIAALSCENKEMDTKEAKKTI